MFKSVASQLEQRRTDLSQSAAIAGGIYRYTNKVTVNNPGEAILKINFPVLFTECPCFYWGAEVDPGSLVTDGGYPMAVPMVRNWLTRSNESTGSRWYVGASVIVVSTGIDLQSLIIACHFEGRAIRGPV